MLGRKTYTQDEFDHCKAAIDQQLAALCDSLMNNDGILHADTVIKLIPEQSVAKIDFGDPR